MKTILYAIAAFTLLLISGFAWNVWQNNRSMPDVSGSEMRQHFIRSIDWLDINYVKVKNRDNPILWWMIKQAAQVSADERLSSIYARYKKEHLDRRPANLSTPMFNEYYRPNVPDISLFSGLDDYQIFFFYGLSCDEDLGAEPLIQKQLSADYCSAHFIHPRCVTHQLMGLRFMQRYRCGQDERVAGAIHELQDLVISELSWDFRVTDAYIQRVLMLVDTGATVRIKAVWLHNILQAQNADGSWDDYHPLINLGDDRFLALTSTNFRLASPKGSFHATAQGIWLLSMLLAEHNLADQGKAR